ncbi:hypothetical protein KJ608_00020 [Patescibacteria group bacterium]|nr:hypothetical protein [Patescibacteria group bacterium]
MRIIKQFFKGLLFFSPTILVIAYVLFQKYEPFGKVQNYSISVADELRTERISFLNSNESRAIENVEGSLFMAVKEVPFGIQMEGKPAFELPYQVNVLAEFSSDNLVEYSFVKWNSQEKWSQLANNWRPLNLLGYQRAVRFNETYVYSREWKDWLRAGSLENWLAVNVNPGETIGVSQGVDLNLEKFANQESNNIKPRGEEITLPWHIRGTVSFWIYLSDKDLSISFTKRDINRYQGEDEYTVKVFGLTDQLLFSRLVEDDGNTEVSYLDYPQEVKIQTLVPASGVYRLVFESNLSRQERSVATDTSIENIVLNADGIVTAGRVNLLRPAQVYTRTNKLTQLRLRCKPESLERLINVEPIQGTAFTIKAPLSGDWYPSSLLQGEYLLQTGTAIELDGLALSPSAADFFDPFIYHFTSQGPRYWVTRLSQPEEKTVFKNVYSLSTDELEDLLPVDDDVSWGIVLREVDSAGNLVAGPSLKIKSLETQFRKPSRFSF